MMKVGLLAGLKVGHQLSINYGPTDLKTDSAMDINVVNVSTKFGRPMINSPQIFFFQREWVGGSCNLQKGQRLS